MLYVIKEILYVKGLVQELSDTHVGVIIDYFHYH